jgi:signal transduction histidine kinase
VNLLENASKYSYPDTEIRVTMKKTAKRVEISVQDSGVGVSKADAKRIFDKFTRVDNELSDTVTGTGFGLYWVKRIVRMHGGSIRVDSEVGKGATFTMRLPLYA